jgi:hypothetical protein
MEKSNNTKPKKVLQFLKAIFRGFLKSVPFGNVAVEIADNVTANSGDAEKPHHYMSIIIQVICLAAVIYAFITKQITVEDLLRLLNHAPSETTGP